jgi:L-cysteine S-thiosulfotransferase
MPTPGSRHLRLAFLLSLATTAVLAQGPSVAPNSQDRVENDRIASLTGQPGDATRGADLFARRQVSTCLLCHSDPTSAQVAAIGPSLADVGSRLSEGQIRLRIVDAARLNPDTVMPSFYVTAGLNRVGAQWRDRPILDAGQIEDLVAFLVTLRTR